MDKATTYEELRQERVRLLNERLAILEEIIKADDPLGKQLAENDTQLANNLSAMELLNKSQ